MWYPCHLNVLIMGSIFKLKKNLLEKKVPHANHVFNNWFWLLAWLKWRIFVFGTNQFRHTETQKRKYKQTTVYVWLYNNVAIRK